MRVELLIIDPQNDFCTPGGKLYVTGAEHDIERLTKMVYRLTDKLDDIHITLDSHHPIHIAHPIWWKDSGGNHPNPFTVITAQDVRNGVWTTTMPSLFKRSLEYVEKLEVNQRYSLVVWPPHCEIGSEGQCVVPTLFAAVENWENSRFAVTDYVTKGSNIYTEHYSAIQADVPDPSDHSTQVNTTLIKTLMNADMILIAGEAGSHCVSNTVNDILTQFGDDSYAKKCVILTDAISPVPGFESLQTQFLDDMKVKGVQLSTTVDILS